MKLFKGCQEILKLCLEKLIFPIDLKLFLIIRLYIHFMYYFAASQLVTILRKIVLLPKNCIAKLGNATKRGCSNC